MSARPHTLASALACALVASLGLAGCGERSQAEAGPVKKADTRASAGTPRADKAFTAPGWTAGDDTSWQAQMRTRAQGQNEHARLTASPKAP